MTSTELRAMASAYRNLRAAEADLHDADEHADEAFVRLAADRRRDQLLRMTGLTHRVSPDGVSVRCGAVGPNTATTRRSSTTCPRCIDAEETS